MSVNLEFHFDFASPNAYYAYQVLPKIERRTGVKFKYVPVLLGGVFRATNNKSPMEAYKGIKNKLEYRALETERFIQTNGISKFKHNPHFPVNTLLIMRGAIYAKKHSFATDYIEAIYSCMWEQCLDMSDPEIVRQALADAGLPSDEVIAGSTDPKIKQSLIDNTMGSVGRGNFGSPTFFVGDEMYFGKDKLRDVEKEIVAQSDLS